MCHPMQNNIVCWKENIYFFKRHMEYETEPTSDGFKRVKNSWRQLTRYNLTDLRETEVEGYRFEEGTERLSLMFVDRKDDNYLLYAIQ